MTGPPVSRAGALLPYDQSPGRLLSQRGAVVKPLQIFTIRLYRARISMIITGNESAMTTTPVLLHKCIIADFCKSYLDQTTIMIYRCHLVDLIIRYMPGFDCFAMCG
jgi:hypothetical protein